MFLCLNYETCAKTIELYVLKVSPARLNIVYDIIHVLSTGSNFHSVKYI